MKKPLCYAVCYEKDGKLKTIDEMRVEWTLKDAKKVCSALNRATNKRGFFKVAEVYFKGKGWSKI